MLFRAQSGALLVSSVCYSEGKSSKGTMFFAASRVVLEGQLFPLLSPDYVFFTQRIVPFDNPTIALLGEGVPK